MEEFKVGGKIVAEDNNAYIIVDIVSLKDKEYLFCYTEKKPIVPQVFEKIKIKDEIYIKLEKNPIILQKVAIKVLQK